jgi:hypothetical protein
LNYITDLPSYRTILFEDSSSRYTFLDAHFSMARTLIAQYSSKQEITLPGVDPNAPPSNTTVSVTKGGGNGRILLITVTNVQFPVTLEVIHQVRLAGLPL